MAPGTASCLTSLTVSHEDSAVDPISLIVAAVVAGASAGLKEHAQEAVKDAYFAFRRLLSDRHGVDVGPIERKPSSEAKQGSLKEDLGDAGAGDDTELIEAARRVVEEVRRHDGAAAQAVGVDLDDVTAEFVRITNVGVAGSGRGVDMDRVHTRGGIVVEGVNVDARKAPDRP